MSWRLNCRSAKLIRILIDGLKMTSDTAGAAFSWGLFALRTFESALTYGIFVAIWGVQRDPSVFGFLVLSVLSIFRAIFTQTAMLATCRLYRHVAELIEKYSKSRSLVSGSDYRTLYRRIQQVFNFSSSREEFCANLISTAGIISIVTIAVGMPGLSIVVMAGGGVVVVKVIQRASIHAFAKVNEFSAHRNEKITRLLNDRESIVGIRERAEKEAESLQRTLLHQRHWLALDSALKVGETYLGMVLKLLPFVIAMGTAAYGVPVTTAKAQLILWITIPLTAAILAAPRQLQAIHGRASAIDASWSLTQSRTRTVDDCIRFGENQRVWRASVRTNLFGSSVFHRQALEELGLWLELGLSGITRPFAFNLDPDRLSEGQKQRLTLLRSVFLALTLRRTLIIDSSLHALDRRNKDRILAFLRRLQSDRVINVLGIEKLGVSSADLNEPGIEAPEVQRRSGREPIKSQKGWVAGLMFASLPIFVIAGSLDAFVTERLNSFGRVDLYSCGAAITAFLLAILSGVAVENAIRKRASMDLSEAIFESSAPSRDISRCVPVDFDTTLEPFSYYAHDLTWAIALFLVFSASAILGAGLKGMALVLITIMILAGLYFFVFSAITAARENYLQSSRDFTFNLKSLREFDVEVAGLTSSSRTERYRAILGYTHFKNWLEANIILIKMKGNLAVGLDLTFQAVLVVGLALFSQSGQNERLITMSFYVAALVGIQRESSRLFVALSGIMTVFPSFEKIRSLKTPRFSSSILWEILPAKLVLKKSISVETGLRYRAQEFIPGITWVTGVSGSGKSTLLMDLFWRLRGEARRVLYLRRVDVPVSGTDWVDALLNTNSWPAGSCVILDEAMSRLSDEELGMMVQHINQWAILQQVIVLVVEHRHEFHYAGTVFSVDQQHSFFA